MYCKDFVKVFNCIPESICDKVVEDYSNDPDWEVHTWYKPTDNTQTAQHSKELDVLFDKDLTVLDEYVRQAITNYYNKINASHLITYFTNIRLNRYSTGTIMSEHVDLIRRRNGDGVPVLSIVGELNSGYRGGEFVMNNEIIKLTKGDILIFPSTFMYPHKVNEVIFGTRYSFVTWAY
jgi:predicted 2-oxoglutarate/Fe(II)-dependent dioxygenase YbiX